MSAGGRATLPPAKAGTTRMLYYFKGSAAVTVGGQEIPRTCGIELDPTRSVEIAASAGAPAEFLVLQGRPIGEPVVQHGPFVMNSKQEIMQAFSDYQRTEFEGPAGWPHKDARGDADHAKAFPRESPRFAQFATDGRRETPAGEVPAGSV